MQPPPGFKLREDPTQRGRVGVSRVSRGSGSGSGPDGEGPGFNSESRLHLGHEAGLTAMAHAVQCVGLTGEQWAGVLRVYQAEAEKLAATRLGACARALLGRRRYCGRFQLAAGVSRNL